MNDTLLRLYVWQLNARALARHDERGEGVVSAAIAVLIMAFLGVAVWGALKATLLKTETKVNDQVEMIGK
jgi:hypothetical protein